MEYPVYLQLRGTENVYCVQGPDRFWECTRIGGQWRRQDVICTSWPDRQRVLDRVMRISQAINAEYTSEQERQPTVRAV